MREQARALIYRWLSPIWPMTLVGLLVGGLAGGIAAPLVAGGSPSATVMIRIDQPIDANQIVTNSMPSLETQQAYLAGEIVYLSSSGFATAVGSEMKMANPPSLAATQQGQSSLVQLTATEPTTDEATAVLDRALKVYAGRVSQLASARTGAAIDAITAVIVEVREEALANSKRDGEPVDQTGLDGKLNQLEQQRLSLQSEQLRAPGIQVIEPITAQPAQSDPSLLIAGGAMLGGLAALAGTLAWRRRSGVIASVSHVDRQISPVLLPVVRLGKRAGSYARSELRRARTLYGQLPPPRSGVILVVGASRYSGTEVVAQLLYMGAMEHASVTSMNVVGEFANLSAADVHAKLAALPTDAGKTVIVDGGSIASAPQMLTVAELAGQIVVAVRIGRDVAAEVEVLLNAVRNEDVPITAICTKGKLAASDGVFPARRRRSDGGRHSVGNRPAVNVGVAVTPIPSVPPRQAPVEGSRSWVGQQVSWADQQRHDGEPFEAPARDEIVAVSQAVEPSEDQTNSSHAAPSATTESSADEIPVPADELQPEEVVQPEDPAPADGSTHDEVSDEVAETPAGEDLAEGQTVVPEPWLPATVEPEHVGETAETPAAQDEAFPLDDQAEAQTAAIEQPRHQWADTMLEHLGQQPEHREETNGASPEYDDPTLPDDHDHDHGGQGQGQGAESQLSETISDAAPDDDQTEAHTIEHQPPHQHWLAAIREHLDEQPHQEPTPQATPVADDDARGQRHGEHTDEDQVSSANGIAQDLQSAPTVETPTVQTRSFGTGVPQRVQLGRDQVPAQDDQPREQHPEPQPELPREELAPPAPPSDENGHRRPWLSLLRRKPSQDEQADDFGQQRQPGTQDEQRRQFDHEAERDGQYQDHTHA